ncbi:MAG: hypothetical protein K0V04_09050 [Deltaproteobacteria bacterium]|nr:hypothetical protein [Deltaproteobacteria bacterium]
MDLLTFFERSMHWCTPQPLRAWARDHVDPEAALDAAHPVHLMWLSSRCYDVPVVFGRIKVRAEYACVQEGDDNALPALREAAIELRAALAATRWWAHLIETWEVHQTQGLGVARYELHARGSVVVRGTAVGSFAVRELRWVHGVSDVAPPLRHREQTELAERHQGGPCHLYAVDHIESGRSLGTFASARVAFEVAERFDAHAVVGRPCPPKLGRVLAEYAGWPPHPEARSWPAEPYWRFAVARLSQQREAVRHAG